MGKKPETADELIINTAKKMGKKFGKLMLPSPKKAGAPPGSVVFVGKQKIDQAIISVLDYNQKKVSEKVVKNLEETYEYFRTNTTSWINIVGLHDVTIIEKLGEKYRLHPLIQEDIVNTNQRPMIEESDEYLFIALKMMYFKDQELKSEHISIIFGKNYVFSFQEEKEDVFDPVRERIRGSRWRIRNRGPDYLAYALIDAVVDNYFLVLEQIGDVIEVLEDELSKSASASVINKIHSLKRDLIFLRKSVWPLREVISKFSKSESSLIKKDTKKYVADVYDHTIQAIDTIESFRDMVGGLLDLYLTQTSNRMNEIMKVLTIFAAIFIPLTFVAGIYGMNFEYMPELASRYGYFFVWAAFLLIGGGMLLFFKRKKWI